MRRAITDTTDRLTALCGHNCDPYQRRNSVLDASGDVVLYHACDGRWWLFRDGNPNGLLATPAGGRWDLTRARHAETQPNVWDMIAAGGPCCTVTPDRDDWVARHSSGRVIVRADTQYGCLARAARYYLRTTETTED